MKKGPVNGETNALTNCFNAPAQTVAVQRSLLSNDDCFCSLVQTTSSRTSAFSTQLREETARWVIFEKEANTRIAHVLASFHESKVCHLMESFTHDMHVSVPFQFYAP